MITAYKQHSQFIMILAVMYLLGVWGGPLIFPVYPMFLILYGLRGRYFEMFIIAIWTLILADYVPVENATFDDMKWIKTLKPLVPLTMFLFFIRDRESFKPYPKLFIYFIPFLLIVSIGLTDSINLQVGFQKTISFVLMYLSVPMFVVILHRRDQQNFWKAVLTFIIGMLTIGLILRFVAPDIAMKVGRFKGVLGNPNGLGLFLNLTFILWILIRRFKLATFTKKENLYIVFVILLSLIWTGSRNGMMSMFLFYVMYKMIQVNWFFALVLLAGILAFNDQLFIVFVGFVEFFGLQGFFRIDSIEEGSGRGIAWVFAWQEIQDYFFIGGGFGHDEHIMRPNYKWLSMQGHSGGVHNSYLSMWMDAGILGLSAYFIAIIVIIGKTMKNNYIIIAFITSIAFNIYFESWLVASLNPFTIIYLTILTIFIGNLSGEDYVQDEFSVADE
ncbi:MAG: O-antigen ligase [Crocinitomix sp.]|jgi:O-antigen ligase